MVRDNATIAATDGPYRGHRPNEALAAEAAFPDKNGSTRHPILGLWMIDQDCCGLGIRESAGPITDNLSSSGASNFSLNTEYFQRYEWKIDAVRFPPHSNKPRRGVTAYFFGSAVGCARYNRYVETTAGSHRDR